ncbi:nucleoside-diphosphate sugar epimerase/dehydratase [Aeromonas salmonicida]|uniref:nucleoside-diphosphate sugar epimerase/dehydratase n=1 Tax=Aeromonas salmonicida TaxID=645 RepID=UPI003D318A23
MTHYNLFESAPCCIHLFSFLEFLREQKKIDFMPHSRLDTKGLGRKMLIFGAGEAGKKVHDILKNKYIIMAFVDNDATKHDDILNGLPIISPRKVANIDFDVIYIASQYCKEIYCQLIDDIGIEPKKLIF